MMRVDANCGDRENEDEETGGFRHVRAAQLQKVLRPIGHDDKHGQASRASHDDACAQG